MRPETERLTQRLQRQGDKEKIRYSYSYDGDRDRCLGNWWGRGESVAGALKGWDFCSSLG